MKAHKYWSFGALICMCMACVSGCNEELKETHKYWGIGSLVCMIMAIYSGHKMIAPSKKKAKTAEEAEATEE